MYLASTSAAPTQLLATETFSGLTGARLRRAIEHYERLAGGLAGARGERERCLRRIYRDIAHHRRQLLSALENGHLEDWLGR